MTIQLLFAFILVTATVFIHALGTLEAIRHLTEVWRRRKEKQWPLKSEIQIVRVVCMLLLLHLLEASMWAAFLFAADVWPDFETAIYFSLTSYTTVGYGDVVLPTAWRLLGPIESAAGILMFGWSTGIMVTAITRIYGSRLHLQGETLDEEKETHG